MRCWQQRGCDEEMALRCPHAQHSDDGICVASCYFAHCGLEQYRFATDLDLLLDPTVDRRAAIKEPCTTCEYFLENGPRLA